MAKSADASKVVAAFTKVLEAVEPWMIALNRPTINVTELMMARHSAATKIVAIIEELDKG